MLETRIEPFFSDTDLLGHINHCMIPVWFEHARLPIFRLFTPSLDAQNWKLIVARIEIDYQAQLYYGKEIFLKTGIEKMGNSSMTIRHQAIQEGTIGAQGKVIMVHFDYKNRKALPIPESIRLSLEKLKWMET